MKAIATLTSALLILVNTASAQFPKVSIPDSEVRQITSTAVAGQTYDLHVMLPARYNESKTYPVLYLLDSQWDFPLLTSLYGQQYYDGFIPEIVIVGITWSGKNPGDGRLRSRDLAPSSNPLMESGVSNFINFLKTELFPFVEANYRVSNTNRSIAGCSLGGTFVLYALFKEPQLFRGYIAASPAYQGYLELFTKLESEYLKNNINNPSKLYMTLGGAERSVPDFERFSSYLKSRNYKSLSIETRIIENTGHSGTKGEGFARGLQYVYARPKLKLPPAVLKKYTGEYKNDGGQSLVLSVENDYPVLSYGGSEKVPLHVANEAEWYSSGEFLNFYFVKKEGKEGVEMATYGRTVFLKKTQ